MSDKNAISNYKYIRTIGEGTFGKVKLAIHILTGEKVAIKILEKNLIKGKREYEKIEREIKYLKLFTHPNIIKIYEVIESSSSFFIVMEYAPGGELFNYIVEKEKLTEKESSFFLYQIIQGVKEIHKKNICHRDIKPENLLFTKNKIIKIIDFGLSSEYENYLSTPCGSPCYASPEMIEGKKYNGLSIDLWACGIILFAMLCGYLPFDDTNNDGLFEKIIEGKIDYPDPIEDDIYLSEDALDLIDKILTSDPEKRIGLEEILEHPFMEYGKMEYNRVIKPENFKQEALIINYMVSELGIENKNNIIEKNIHENRHNNITTTYHLLKSKFMEGRLRFIIKEKIIKQFSKKDCLSNILSNNLNNIKNNLSNNNINNSVNYNNYINFNYNYSKIKFRNTKHIFNFDENKENRYNNYTTRNNYSSKKRSQISSNSPSNRNLQSMKDIIRNKDFEKGNNIIIINNTNMLQEPSKLKPIYNELFFKYKNSQNSCFRKIETSMSLEKSVNKNNLTSNNIDNKLNNTFNVKEQIKVCLKKEDKNESPFIYFRNSNYDDLRKRKCIYNNLSVKSNSNSNSKEIQRRNNQIGFLIYKKNLTGMNDFKRNFNNLYSFEGNNSNNYNMSHSNKINALSNDNINANFNSFKNEICGHSHSTSRNRYNDNIKNIFIKNDNFSNKKNNPNVINTIEINKESEIMDKSIKLKNKIEKNRLKNGKNFEKICRRIFTRNKNKLSNYNRKKSYDNNNKINENNKIKLNRRNNNKALNHQYKKQSLCMNYSKKDCFNPSTSRIDKIKKKLFNHLTSHNVNNKLLIKNILRKNKNNNYNPKKLSQIQMLTTIENNSNKLKKSTKKRNKQLTNLYGDINYESFRENDKKASNKISTLKNLSPMNNIKQNANNINSLVKLNKKSKINNNIKDILSLKGNLLKNKEMNYKSNRGNILHKEKDSMILESTSRNNLTNSNCNYIPITARDNIVFASRNRNNDSNLNLIKSNTILLEQKQNMNNQFLSTERKNYKNGNECNSQSKDQEKNININLSKINNNDKKQIIISKRQKNNEDKFLVANTEMTLYQIWDKLVKFCKENNLNCLKEGLYNFIISTKNNQNFFKVEITHLSPLNIVKFFHGKNTESKMKEIITRLFIEIVNY